MPNYRRGRQLEYDVIAIFKAAGFNAIRGAGSKGEFDGVKVDAVVSRRGAKNVDTIYVYAFQCKRTGV